MPNRPITPAKFAWLLSTRYRRHIVIGVTGHRDLLAEDKATITAAVHEQLKTLAGGRPVLLLSALAKGADQWVAECARSLPNVTLFVPLTMTEADFIGSGFDKDSDQADIEYVETRLADPKTLVVKLYGDSLYANGQSLTSRQRDLQYEELGKFMVQHGHHLIALWDGVDGGGVGGTSDVVKMMVQGKSLLGGTIRHKKGPQHLYQYVVRRAKNHFPLGRRFEAAQLHWPTAAPGTWVATTLPNRRDGFFNRLGKAVGTLPMWYGLIGAAIGVLAGIDLFIKTPNLRQDGITWSLIGLIYALAGYTYQRFRLSREMLLQFAYPLVLALAVLGLGTYGFYEGCLGNTVDSFFGAANLITLNTSVFSTLSVGEQHIVMNPWLKTARILGGFLAGYAFILAFALAAGKENVGRFRFWLHRRFGNAFTVVLGDGVKALDLTLDLTHNHGRRVIWLGNQIDASTMALVSPYRVWVFQGKITTRSSLEKTYFWLAEAVYAISDLDEDNFRCAQELDELYVAKHHPTTNGPVWYVHLQNNRQRALLQQISRRYLRTFSVSENTARRLLLRYPIDRFVANQSAIAEVMIVGFGELGQELALACLRLGHYTPDKRLHLTVYHRPDDQPAVDAFRAEHPELFPQTTGPFAPTTALHRVRQYTFVEQGVATDPAVALPYIDFRALPTAESALVDPAFSLYQAIQPDRAVSIYVCLPTGLESASLLGSLLPRLEWLKAGHNQPAASQNQTDVQVFCFYNFPDPDEEQYVEMKLNGLASYVPVFCFGNFIHECSATAIQNKSLHGIAKQIALLYACLYGDSTVLDELPELKQVLTALKIDIKEGKAGWPADKNEALIAKAKRLLPELHRRQKGTKTEQDELTNWLDTCWQQIKEIDRESNSQAADHAWVKLRLTNRHWDQVLDDSLLGTFWQPGELAQLGEVEHRRWNAEKLLYGWHDEPDKALWEAKKGHLRNQKRHNLLRTFDQLDEADQNKDYTQVLGIPYFFVGMATKKPMQT